MAARDYSDSEDGADSGRDPIEDLIDEPERDTQSAADDNDLDNDLLMAASDTRSSAGPSSKATAPPDSASSNPPHLRIKLRHPNPKPERESLSPAPPLRLKFGVPRATKAEKADYSSSESEGEKAEAPVEQQPKASGSKKSRQNAGAMQSSKKRSISAPNPSAASQRKSYDWLTPSTAGASHHGPVGRHDQGIPMPHLGWPSRNADGELLDDPSGGASVGAGGSGSASKLDARQSAEARRRSHKRRREGDPPGPGKAWRKGLGKKTSGGGGRKGDLDTPMGTTPDNSRPGSPVEGTPEMEPSRALENKIDLIVDRDEPFVLADAATLGFPVFSKPIVPTRMTLTNFPKVTPYFQPNNGGDTGPFPRREKVRGFKNSERTIIGVGGGTLRFKSWTKGPPSELSLILRAEREAQEIRNKLAKEREGSDPKTKPGSSRPPLFSSSKPSNDGGDDTPVKGETTPVIEGDTGSTPGSPPKKVRPPIKEGGPKKSRPSKPKTPRPSMPHSTSTDSLASMSSLGANEAEAGDNTPAQASKGPRKSKLAQEIRPEIEYGDDTP